MLRMRYDQLYSGLIIILGLTAPLLIAPTFVRAKLALKYNIVSV